MNDSAALLDLKKKDHKKLVKISDSASVNSPRAKALLLIAEGDSAQEAADKTTLSLGQVRYWLGRYRANGIACFPIMESENKPLKEKKDKNKKAKKTAKKAKEKSKKDDKKKASKNKKKKPSR